MILSDIQKCERCFKLLTNSIRRDFLIKKMKRDKMRYKNESYSKILDEPFKNKDTIIEYAKMGVIIASDFRDYMELQEIYYSYENHVRIFHSNPKRFKNKEEQLEQQIEKIKSKVNRWDV